MRLHEHEQRLYRMAGKDVKAKVVSAVAAADPQSPIAHGRKNFDAWGLPAVLSSVNHEVLALLLHTSHASPTSPCEFFVLLRST